jgi:sugar phosphate isomerase/epimerase
MELLFAKSFWEVDAALPFRFDDLLAMVAEAGFDATELFLPFFEGGPKRTITQHSKHGLGLIGAIATVGDTPEEHRASLETQVARAVRFEPLLINSHTGRDIFSFDDNLRIFERALELSERYGVGIVHETHRTRPTYSAIDTVRYLEALPELRLTADVSHWMVVHESDLSDQPEAVAQLVERSDHIHARVGFEEGPQVADPRAPEWRGHLERHADIWKGIASAHRARGSDLLTVTPEFGPFPYVPTIPFTRQPLVDVWEVNLDMKEALEVALAE